MKTQYNKSTIKTLIFISTFMLVSSANANGRFKGKAVTTNPNGGVTAVKGGVAKGQNGGGYARVRGATTNGQGQATGGGATTIRGPNGGGAVRGGSFTADDSGNVNYHGSTAATGANGSAATTGGFNRSEGGGIMGSRSSTATATNGNTYNGNTTYQSGSGVNHTQACHDAYGNEIKCPSK